MYIYESRCRRISVEKASKKQSVIYATTNIEYVFICEFISLRFFFVVYLVPYVRREVSTLPGCHHRPCIAHGKHISWQQYLQYQQKKKITIYACILAEYRYIKYFCRPFFIFSLFLVFVYFSWAHKWQLNRTTSAPQPAQVWQEDICYVCNCIFSSHFHSLLLHFIPSTRAIMRWWLQRDEGAA